MGTITLPNFRTTADVTMNTRLKDGGMYIDWAGLSNIKAWLYSDAQKAIAGRCDVSIDQADSTMLVCEYSASKPQYLGVNRLIVQATYGGRTKTYDKPAFNFVRWTADQAGEQITIDDPVVDVEIVVEDVSSSILQEAVDAAFSAADRANEAAEEAEHMVDIHTGPAGKSPYIGENGHWYEWDEETHQYVDTETNAKGDTGETPDISIGTVTTVEPGAPAAASMGGTPEAPVLNLSIPKGAVGSTPNISVGTVTTGAPGTPVVIEITGTAEAPVLNITIPQGMKGDTGVSADYPITIYNGLDSSATDQALAAFQGKVLNEKVGQLEHKVTNLKGKFYGFYPSAEDLPEGDEDGFAYVGEESPFAVFNFRDEEWTDSGSVVTIASGTTFTPDADDLSLDNSVLKFADRNYNAQQPNGRGYKILRKDATFAEQVTVANTVYEIRYDFDLNAGSISIPAGCVLKFTGGKLSNGTVVGARTRIVADLVQIFGTDITFEGDFVIDKSFPEWFGAVGMYYQSSNEATQPTGLVIPQAADSLVDAGPMINNAFDLAKLSTGVVFMQRQIYRIETKVVIPSKCTLETQEDTVFDVRMLGSGANKIVQSPETSEFGSETPFASLSLYPNEFFAPTSMAVAFEIGSVKTALIGRGVITLLNSKYTIGILVPGTGYQVLDMSYESPYIDIRTVGGKINTIAPDNRDLYGPTDPSNDIGENGQYYWNTTTKTYFLKANGTWAEQWAANQKGSLFNVSLRIDIGAGWNSGRVIRPKIKLWDMGGWRGIEIYTHNGGWCNDGWWEGSVSNKHGSYISLFTNYDIGFHNFEQVTCQIDGSLQNDGSIFYAIRAGYVVGPRTWDLQWIQPARANISQQNLSSAVLYFGRYVSNSRIYLDGNNLKYFVDYGRNNETSAYASNVSYDMHPDIVAASGFINLFKYRTPDIAAWGVDKHYKQITTLYSNIADLIAGEFGGQINNVQAPATLFDDDENTFESLIDCSNSIYGTIIKIGGNNTGFDTGAIKDNKAFLEFFYRHVGYNSSLDKKVFAALYCSNPGNSSSSVRQLFNGNSINYLSEILPTCFYTSAQYYLILFTTANLSGYKLNVCSICYWIKNLRNDTNGLSGKLYGKTRQKINAPAPGALYYDTDLGVPFINVGTSSQPDWQIINAGTLPKAKFVNVNPGQEMTWKGLDGVTKSSIQAVVETPDVQPITRMLFMNNRTLREIPYYPISTPTTTAYNQLFANCTYLEVVPFINLTGITDINQIFSYCTSLKEIPKYDMSTVTILSRLFFECRAIETIPLLDWQNVTNATEAFYRCYALKNVGGFAGCSVSLDMSDCANLTKESVVNIFNNLATVETSQTITLNATVYALLSANDIAIAEGKGWTVAHN